MPNEASVYRTATVRAYGNLRYFTRGTENRGSNAPPKNRLSESGMQMRTNCTS